MNEKVATESDWVSRCQAGDLAAWRTLYDQYLPVVYRVCNRMGVPPADLGDVCQEVFLRVYRALGGFRGEAQFSTWLYRIALNEAARSRRSGSVRLALSTFLRREPVVQPISRPDDELARTEAARELERILARMKPKQREVFVLFELEELGLEEIAEVLGCPLETVRSRLRHARADFDRLRRQRELVVSQGGSP